jgi:hypothetical protein
VGIGFEVALDPSRFNIEGKSMSTEQKTQRVSSLYVLSSAALAVTAGSASQAGAAVIVTHVNASVGFASGDMSVDLLPVAGSFNAGVATSTFGGVSHSLIIAGTTAANFQIKTQQIGNYGFARPLAAGVKFADAPTGTAAGGYIEYASTGGIAVGPGLFSNKYYSFSFIDGGGVTDYGWIEGSLTDTSYAGLNYNITEYAYDDTGAQLATGSTGSVPEPTTAGTVLAGLLVTGAAGVRRHKRTVAATVAA